MLCETLAEPHRHIIPFAHICSLLPLTPSVLPFNEMVCVTLVLFPSIVFACSFYSLDRKVLEATRSLLICTAKCFATKKDFTMLLDFTNASLHFIYLLCSSPTFLPLVYHCTKPERERLHCERDLSISRERSGANGWPQIRLTLSPILTGTE